MFDGLLPSEQKGVQVCELNVEQLCQELALGRRDDDDKVRVLHQ